VDCLTFISELLKSVAWPVAVVAIVFLLRKHVNDLIPLLRKLKYKEFELEFGKEVKEIEAAVAEAIPPSSTTRTTTTTTAGMSARPGEPTMEERALELARISPRAAIFEAWRDIEIAALDLARRKQIPTPPNAQVLGVIRALVRANLLDDKMHEVIENLRSLRNKAVHHADFEVSVNATEDFVRSASRVAQYLRRI
jgi:hypothetical protein